MKRAVIMVLDSLGVGALPDALDFGDVGANTFGHIYEAKEDLNVPNLLNLGFGNIQGMDSKLKKLNAKGSFGKANEVSKGKDTITGHFEIAGVLTEKPFKTYPDGFPKEFIKAFEKEIGIEVIGNYAASGTIIIEDLGPEHENTGKPIVYTSNDSVFQIAANIDIIPLEELYNYCKVARKLLVGEWACGRVIARPYKIIDNKRVRTSDRRDYAVSPPYETLLNRVSDGKGITYAIGKIKDIYNGSGVDISVHTESNLDGINKTIEALNTEFEGLIFTNLVDFDSKYGHRRDPIGYGKALEEFDSNLPRIIEKLNEDDILIITADHGNDPMHSGYDHTREYIPVVIFGNNIKAGVDLGVLDSFADLGATVADYLEVESIRHGISFLDKVKK